jgi:hypothetical protein
MANDHTRHDKADNRARETAMDHAEMRTAQAESVRAAPHLSMRTARWLAWSLWAATVAEVISGLLLAVLNRLSLE